MAEVEIYTTMMCPFCWRAKSLLKKKGVAFTDIGVDGRPDKRREMSERAGGNQLVPQIFIDGTAIGGFLTLAERIEFGHALRAAIDRYRAAPDSQAMTDLA